MNNQYIVGHRGAKGEAPENTMKAFRIGCKSSAQVIECDLNLSKDKELVVIHDDSLNRTTNGKGKVYKYTLADLKKFDAGDGESIPTLNEVLKLVISFRKKLIIEVKGKTLERVKETTDYLLRYLESIKDLDQIIIHSFWPQAIKLIKKRNPKIKTAILMRYSIRPKKALSIIKSTGADGASISRYFVTKRLVKKLKEEKLNLDSWVLNNKRTFNRLKKMGVNGLITDYPSKFSPKV